MTKEIITIARRWFSSLPPLQIEIECGAELAPGVKLGLAVKAALARRENLTGAVLTNAVLTNAVLTGAVLTDADLTGADLTGAVLTRAVLTRADLTRAVLTNAVLTGAVLTNAVLTGAVLPRAVQAMRPADEEEARQRIAAVAQAALQDNALNMGDWHTCETTHCIAGWAVHQAGNAGYLLEQILGPHGAGAVLLGHEASTHFYDTADQARVWLTSFLPDPVQVEVQP